MLDVIQLRVCQNLIDDGLNPRVKYSDDQNTMRIEALQIAIASLNKLDQIIKELLTAEAPF